MTPKWSLALLLLLSLEHLFAVSALDGLSLDGDLNQLPASRPPAGRMLVLDKLGRKSVRLLPGLLDESLLSRGSFKFNSRITHFDRLNVRGNVYANKVNGLPLREAYLFKNRAYNLKPSEPAKPFRLGARSLAAGEQSTYLVLEPNV